MTKITNFRDRNKRLLAQGWSRLTKIENPIEKLLALINQNSLLAAGMPRSRHFSNLPVHVSVPLRQIELNMMTGSGSNSEREEKLLSMVANRCRLDELRTLKPMTEEEAREIENARLMLLTKLLADLLDCLRIARRAES